MLATQARVLSAWLGGNQVLDLCYEDLFGADGNLRSNAAARIGDFLGLDLGRTELETPLKKLADPSYAWLGNAEAFLSTFAGTEFNDLVTAALKR